jgi:diaminohydroxyphosphoribosylaminopyrimidine deaminase/5-amino-6-(5-phosphoribosylamino)uracil reductase
VLPLPSEGGRVSLPALLDALGQRGLTSLIVEGGAQVHAAFLQAGQVDEVRLFLAPRILGGDGLSWIGPLGVSQVDRSWTLDGISVQQVGADLLLTGRPRSPEA